MEKEEIQKLNEEFCKVVGIKQASCGIKNLETDEIRYYVNTSSLSKLPVGWKEAIGIKFDTPKYPDLIENERNFLKLLNVQWFMFKSLGQCYKNFENEPFQIIYLKTRLQAINICKSFGGGEMLDEYLKTLRATDFEYGEIDDFDVEYD